MIGDWAETSCHVFLTSIGSRISGRSPMTVEVKRVEKSPKKYFFLRFELNANRIRIIKNTKETGNPC